MNAILVVNLPDHRFAALLDVLRPERRAPPLVARPVEAAPAAPPNRPRRSRVAAGYEVALLGEAWAVASLAEALHKALARLHDVAPELFEALARDGGRTRPIVARSPEALYPGNPGLADKALSVGGGWWVGTNYSRRDVERIFERIAIAARRVMGVDLGLRLRAGPGLIARENQLGGSRARGSG
jgi:hypothetical protein